MPFDRTSHGVGEGSASRPRLEIWARVRNTLDRPLGLYHNRLKGTRAVETKYGNRVA